MKKKSKGSKKLFPYVTILLTFIVLSFILSSCNLVQQRSRAFENTEAEASSPEESLKIEKTEPTSTITGEESESSKIYTFETINRDDVYISKGEIATFTAKNGVNTTAETKPSDNPTPTPTPIPANVMGPNLSIGTGSGGAPYTVRVFLDKQQIVIYGTNASGQEVPLRKMITSTGRSGYATPQTGENGYFKLGGRSRWVKFNLMPGSATYHQYARNFSGNDINGRSIGRHYFFHSTTFTIPNDPSSLDRNTFNRLGKTASSGCIRLNVADAKYIYDLPNGTKVKVLKSSSGYNLSVGGLAKFTLSNKHPKGWDPYDPDPRNPFRGLATPTPAPTPTPVPTTEPTVTETTPTTATPTTATPTTTTPTTTATTTAATTTAATTTAATTTTPTTTATTKAEEDPD